MIKKKKKKGTLSYDDKLNLVLQEDSIIWSSWQKYWKKTLEQNNSTSHTRFEVIHFFGYIYIWIKAR